MFQLRIPVTESEQQRGKLLFRRLPQSPVDGHATHISKFSLIPIKELYRTICVPRESVYRTIESILED